MVKAVIRMEMILVTMVVMRVAPHRCLHTKVIAHTESHATSANLNLPLHPSDKLTFDLVSSSLSERKELNKSKETISLLLHCRLTLNATVVNKRGRGRNLPIFYLIYCSVFLIQVSRFHPNCGRPAILFQHLSVVLPTLSPLHYQSTFNHNEV